MLTECHIQHKLYLAIQLFLEFLLSPTTDKKNYPPSEYLLNEITLPTQAVRQIMNNILSKGGDTSVCSEAQ